MRVATARSRCCRERSGWAWLPGAGARCRVQRLEDLQIGESRRLRFRAVSAVVRPGSPRAGVRLEGSHPPGTTAVTCGMRRVRATRRRALLGDQRANPGRRLGARRRPPGSTLPGRARRRPSRADVEQRGGRATRLVLPPERDGPRAEAPADHAKRVNARAGEPAFLSERRRAVCLAAAVAPTPGQGRRSLRCSTEWPRRTSAKPITSSTTDAPRNPKSQASGSATSSRTWWTVNR